MNLDLPKRYELDADPVLGEGGMGRVLRARDVVLDMPVALKVVRPDLAADPRFRKLFDLEIRISARFDHPHIVPLHDHGVTSLGTPYLGLAYADAGSLARFRTETVSWSELSAMTLELLDALAHLHSRGVIHRDLKHENVLLHTGADGKRHIWLADLGLANAAKDLARIKGRMEGTPGFMSPEQRLGMPREYGPWTDMYALGVILWEITTGSRPFPDHQTALDGPLPDFAPRPGLKLPAELPGVLANLLCPEPLSRYDLVADLRTEILALGAPTLGSGATAVQAVPGTVAPSAGSHSSDIGLVEDDGINRETSTLFQISASDVRSENLNVPAWNRPLPQVLPRTVPPERGAGGVAVASLPLFALRDTPLVGREPDRQALWDHARAVCEQRKPRVVLVIGEAGSGKARLVESVLLALEEGGWAESVRLAWQKQENADDGYVGAARALLRPWNESRASLSARLRRRLARERGRYDRTIQAEAETLARWCGLLEEGEEPVAGGLGLREVYRHLDARTWRGLSCLLLSDVAWSRDEGDGLAIAEAVLASEETGVANKPLLVLATLRTEELHADPALAERIAALQAAGAHRLDLARLGRKQTLRLLEESLRLAPGLAQRVVQRCEGNPLFARQILLEWASRGWLVDTGDLTFDLAPGVDADAVLPKDAADLFEDRVERLCDASGSDRRFRDAVHMAALAGRTLPRDLVIGLGGEGLMDFIRGCGLWVDRDDKMSFDGTMLHQAMLSQAEGRADVAYLHRRLGRSWAKYGEQSGADVAMAAGRHAALGKDWKLAAEQLIEASERAWHRGQSHDLDESSSLGFEVVRKNESLWGYWGRAALLRGRSLQMQGEAADAGAAFEEALQRLAADERVAQSEALCGQGWSWLQRGKLDLAEKVYGEAVERAREGSDPKAEAVAIAGKAWVEQQKRNFDGADILFTRAVNRLSRLDDERALAEAILGQAFVARRTGDFAEASELYEEAAEAFAKGEDPIGRGRANLGLALTLRQQGKLDEASEVLKEALGQAEELGAMHLMMEIRLAMGDVYRARGNEDRARKIYTEQVGWADRHSAFEASILANLGLTYLALAQADLDGAYDAMQATVARLEKVPGHWLWATYRLAVANLLAARGDAKQTFEWLWSAEELGLRDTVDEDVAKCLERILEIAIDKGEDWRRVTRLAAKLVVPQLERLGRRDRAREVSQVMGTRA